MLIGTLLGPGITRVPALRYAPQIGMRVNPLSIPVPCAYGSAFSTYTIFYGNAAGIVTSPNEGFDEQETRNIDYGFRERWTQPYRLEIRVEFYSLHCRADWA